MSLRTIRAAHSAEVGLSSLASLTLLKMNVTKSIKRIVVVLAFIALTGTWLGGCVFRHRTPAVFRFTLRSTTGADCKVKFFLEYKETDPSNGVTRFVTKGEREVSSPSGSPSAYTWDALITGERFQGGIWQGRVQVSVLRKDLQRIGAASEVYVCESEQQVTLPYEAPADGTVIPFAFTLTPNTAPENVSGFRITVP